jgi:hypothetical protein
MIEEMSYPRTCRVLESALGEELARGEHWPDRVWERAWSLGVGATLGGYARGRGVQVPEVARRMELASAAAGVARRGYLAQVLEVFNREGIDCVVHKGDVLGASLYGEGRWRSSGDLDLMIEAERLEDAGRLLGGLGYGAMYDEAPRVWELDEWAFVHGGSGQVVELHWALAPMKLRSPSWKQLWASRRRAELGSSGWCWGLGGAHEFLGICYHVHRHVGHLKGFLDVASWLDRYGRGACYGEALHQARELGVEGIVRWSEGVSAVSGDGVGCVGLERLLVNWSRGQVEGALLGRGRGVEMKVEEIEQWEVLLWQAAAGLAVDGMREKIRVILYPFTYSPEVWASRRGGERVEWVDYVRCGLRPGELAYRQLFGTKQC